MFEKCLACRKTTSALWTHFFSTFASVGATCGKGGTETREDINKEINLWNAGHKYWIQSYTHFLKRIFLIDKLNIHIFFPFIYIPYLNFLLYSIIDWQEVSFPIFRKSMSQSVGHFICLKGECWEYSTFNVHGIT